MSAVEQQIGRGGAKEESTQGSRDQRSRDILDREVEQPEAEPGGKESRQVESGWRRSAEILVPPERQRHADGADRHIEIKNRAPGKISGKKSSDDRAHGRPDHRRD